MLEDSELEDLELEDLELGDLELGDSELEVWELVAWFQELGALEVGITLGVYVLLCARWCVLCISVSKCACGELCAHMCCVHVCSSLCMLGGSVCAFEFCVLVPVYV